MAERRTHVELTEEQHSRLKHVARRHDRSLQDVIHEAIDLFLREVAPDTNEPGESPREEAAKEKPPAP
jgi:predicted transcriptional regulator